MKKTLLGLFLFASLSLFAQTSTITVHADKGERTISKHIYGQFAEHLGNCIYGGIWVGENSPIPNTKGYRNDVLEALKRLKIPNLRWPGGCFADEYHWQDGIGPREKRPKMVNNNWGGAIEDNSFGTHEFLNLCELIGTEPYISGNVGSGTVEELAKWVEYMTSEGDSPMANLRRKNGRDKAWKVKFLGVGNESWGCGGSMTPAYYSDLFRRYSTYCREYDGNKLYKIASGASDYDYNWTETLMTAVGNRMSGLSLHYYTCKTWNGSKGSATNFDTNDYYWTLGKSLEIEEVVKKHIGIMDKYDPQKKIGLLVDEWGTWWDVEPGTNPGFLFQQNTMRDAMVAATTLNIFHKYTDRVQMANIAQIVNVLQSMILTKGDKMALTPTYYVFEMYKVHQDATFLPMDLTCSEIENNGKKIPAVSATASKDASGVIHISLANMDLSKEQKIKIDIQGFKATGANGTILTSKNIADHNTFETPNVIAPSEFKGAKINKGVLEIDMPAKSIVTITLK